MGLSRSAPPTSRQIAALQAYMLYRSSIKAGKALGVSDETIRRDAHLGAKRAANIDGWAQRGAG